MKARRKFRPTVNGLEQRLALNGTLGAAGLIGHVATAAPEMKTGGMGHKPHHTTHHHHTTHKK